ncbi:MAG: LEA type 2 family protein [Flavobacteriales bacterium]|nr:LEA type 2 family protein [Flavobacteriales bacterium]
MQNFPNKILLLSILLVALQSCNYEDVEVRQVDKVKIDKFDNKGIELSASLHIFNPNSYPVKVTSSDAILYLNGRKAGKMKLLNRVEVPAKFDDFIVAKVRTDFDEGSASLLPIILGAAVKGGVDIRAAGDIRAKSFLIGKKFDFDFTHKARF